MCDDVTENENEAYLSGGRLSRRQVGLGAGAAVAGLLAGCKPPVEAAQEPAPSGPPAGGPAPSGPPADGPAPSASAAPSPSPAGRTVTVATPDGRADAFFVTPGAGRHPAVILWPDVAGLREAYRAMATRLAADGYAVLAVNQYYRSSPAPVLASFADWRTDEGKAKLAPMREALTPEGTARDAVAFAAWLDAQPEVDPARKMASTGYCMGGPFAFRTAAAVPDRVGAIASFHGAGLVTDGPSSPHALFAKMKAAALVCVAQNDDAREPTAKDTLRQAAEAAEVPLELEVYPAQHGFCTIDAPVYDEAQAERAWARLLATLRRYL